MWGWRNNSKVEHLPGRLSCHGSVTCVGRVRADGISFTTPYRNSLSESLSTTRARNALRTAITLSGALVRFQPSPRRRVEQRARGGEILLELTDAARARAQSK